MTCQNLHNFFADDLRVETDLLPDSAELAEHIASCPPCNRFVEGQKELKKHLHLLRDSAPPIPASLDNAVVANYRSLVLERSCLVKSTPVTRRINPRGALGWATAVAFAVVVAYGGMLLFIPRPRVWEDRQGTALQPMVPQRIANKETARAQKITRKAPKSLAGSVKRETDAASLAKRDNSFPTRFQKITRKAPKSLAGSVKRETDAASLAKRDNSFPTRFQSLMYCDQISCPGAMEVIRVQLPSPVLGLTPASARANGAVSADVLVGPDGIARGIRVVE